MSVQSINRYLWAKRRDTAQKLKIVKFVEALWRFIFYGVFVVIGVYALVYPVLQPWMVDTEQLWVGWPYQPIDSIITFYIQVQLGAYVHQLLWTEVSRSDALEMILHHFVTILLIISCHLINFTRVGTAILLLHDSADIFLEFAKVLNYASKAKGQKFLSPVCDVLFGCFAITFYVTRLYIYPKYLVYSVVFECPEMLGGTWPAWFVFSALLCTLLVLHLYWGYLIARMIVKLFAAGNVEKDERSDDEDEEEEEYKQD